MNPWPSIKRALHDPALHAPTTRTLGALCALANSLDLLTMGELASELNSPQPAITKCVSSLEEQGLVERFPNPAQRNQVFVRLTARGKATIRRISNGA